MPRRRFFPVLFSLLSVLDVHASDGVYLQELIDRAQAMHLAQRPEWHALLHYKPNLIMPGVHSLADDPAFFNADNGKTDPEAELSVTLKSFFFPEPVGDKAQHPQCAFIARYHWLQQELAFDPRRLLVQSCKHFSDWRQGLNPQELTLVFPSAYLNNPSSMYGHTLLRIDAKDQDERTRLLAYTVNYAAPAGADNGFMFAIKGLFGGYAGEFSLMPYYLKVRDYSDLENRDIWEYRLNFTAEETDRMLMHAWELAPIYFDYYFFDENCSYHLLSLLDVARPGLNSTDRFRWWALPIDTVRAVVEHEGLLKDVVYRPASSTILRQRMQTMSDDHLSLAKNLAEGKMALTEVEQDGMTPKEQADILEFAQEYLNYLRLSGEHKGAGNKRRTHELLSARSKLDIVQALPAVPVPEARPDHGHETARLGLGLGEKDNRRYLEFRIRPTYHDLLDPEAGYVRGAEINFFSLTLRQFENSDSVKVENFIPIEIQSLTPRDRFFKPLSWKINVGGVRKRLADDSEPLVFRVNGGAGFSAESSRKSLYYALLDTTLDISHRLQKDYALGAGPNIGWLYDVTSAWRFQLSGRAQRFGLGDHHTMYDLILEQRYSLTPRTALRLLLSRHGEFDHYWNNANIAWHYYF